MITNNKEVKEYIDRIERLTDSIEDFKNDIKDIKLEAKNKGYDPKTLTRVLKIRKKGMEAYTKEQDELDLYLAAAGLINERL